MFNQPPLLPVYRDLPVQVVLLSLVASNLMTQLYCNVRLSLTFGSDTQNTKLIARFVPTTLKPLIWYPYKLHTTSQGKYDAIDQSISFALQFYKLNLSIAQIVRYLSHIQQTDTQ